MEPTITATEAVEPLLCKTFDGELSLGLDGAFDGASVGEGDGQKAEGSGPVGVASCLIGLGGGLGLISATDSRLRRLDAGGCLGLGDGITVGTDNGRAVGAAEGSMATKVTPTPHS